MGCVSAVTKLSIVRDRFTPTSRIVTLCTPSARLRSHLLYKPNNKLNFAPFPSPCVPERRGNHDL